MSDNDDALLVVLLKSDSSHPDLETQLISIGCSVANTPLRRGNIDEAVSEDVATILFIPQEIAESDEKRTVVEEFLDHSSIPFLVFGDPASVDPEALGMFRPCHYLPLPSTTGALEVMIQNLVREQEHKQALLLSEKQLRSIVHNSPLAVVATDPSGKITFINKSAASIFGAMENGGIGSNIDDIVSCKQELGNKKVSLAKFSQEESKGRVSYILTNRIGDNFVANIHAATSPYKDTYSVLCIEDITIFHEQQAKENLLSIAFENLYEGVVITPINIRDNSLIPIYANKAFYELCEYSRVEWDQSSLLAILSEKDRQWLLDCLKVSLNTYASYSREVALFPKSGEEITAQWSLTIISPDKGASRYAAHTIRNISHIRRLEENIRQSQKMEAVGQLASGIAHDFNNIIAIITGLAEVITIKEPADSPSHGYAQRILQSSKRGANIVAKLMAFSRTQPPSSEFINAHDALEQIEPLLKHLLPPTLVLKISCEKDIPSIPLTLTQFEQIILNLATNAADAIGLEKGEINISVSVDSLIAQVGNRLVPPLPPNDYICLKFSDTGGGIPEEIRQKVFDPFFTTKEVGKGTGLGLSTVYGIVSQAGGAIALESSPGEGTTFTFYFPPHSTITDALANPANSPAVPYKEALEKAKPIKRAALNVSQSKPTVYLRTKQKSIERMIVSAVRMKKGKVVPLVDDTFDPDDVLAKKDHPSICVFDTEFFLQSVSDSQMQNAGGSPGIPVILLNDPLSTGPSVLEDKANITLLSHPFPFNTILKLLDSGLCKD